MLTRPAIHPIQWLRHRWRNRLQTLLLLSFLGGYLWLIGSWLFGASSALWLLGMAGLLMLWVPVGSPHLFLRLNRAQPLPAWKAPELHRILNRLSYQADLPVIPSLYLLPTGQPNALATGDLKQPCIAVSQGLLNRLTQRELTGVLAHEISHLKNGDLNVMRLAEIVGRLTLLLSLMGQVMVILSLPLILIGSLTVSFWPLLLLAFAPQISQLAQLRLSRVREFDADLSAARLTGDPEGLAQALINITPRTNPLIHLCYPGAGVPPWLRTHPPTEERVKRLAQLRTGNGHQEPQRSVPVGHGVPEIHLQWPRVVYSRHPRRRLWR